jgi:hypothetical protein
MTDFIPFRSGPLPEARDLAIEPDAARWAASCGWLPGTGHCRKRDCSIACILRPGRDAEGRRIARRRRLRRAAEAPFKRR